MAYVALTLRGGNESSREQIQDALNSYFETGWGEVAVELTHEGSHWRIDSAWAHPTGRHREDPDGAALDCRDKVANALLLAGAPVVRRRR